MAKKLKLIIKKKALLLIIALLSFMYSFSQNTSKTEYLYMTKGLKVQLESGLDTKKGYKLDLLSKIKEGKYLFQFILLTRTTAKTNRYAGIAVVATSSISGSVYYRGIPAQGLDFEKENPYMLNFKTDLKSWDSAMTDAYSFALSKFMSATFLTLYQNESAIK